MSMIEASTLEAVTARLDQLERENRRLRLAATAALLGVCLAVGVAAVGLKRRSGTIEAQRLVIRDRDGRVRGTFGVDGGGLPSLRMLDRRGLEQVELGVPSEDAASLMFSDRGSPRILMDTSIEGNTGLRLYDGARQIQAGISLDADGSPRVTLSDTVRAIINPATPGDSSPLRAGGSTPAAGEPGSPLSATAAGKSAAITRDSSMAVDPAPRVRSDAPGMGT